MQELNVAISADASSRAEAMRKEGQTVLYLAADRELIGLFGVSDPVKPTSAMALEDLAREGLHVIMLTGDSQTTAEAIARKLGIRDFEAEVLPERKSEVIQRLQQQGRVVAMAGDGINDAPALAQAQVGIAMSTGTDIAMHSSGITLLRGDLRGILRARRLSQATMRNIRQNLFFAFIYNALGVPLAAGVLYPFTGWMLHPVFAAAAMSLSSVSVITQRAAAEECEAVMREEGDPHICNSKSKAPHLLTAADMGHQDMGYQKRRSMFFEILILSHAPGAPAGR